MNDIDEIRKNFFTTLVSIQDESIITALGEYQKEGDIEDLLYNATYEVIVRILEIVDGYSESELSIDLVDSQSMKSLKNGIELHDACVDYIKYKKP